MADFRISQSETLNLIYMYQHSEQLWNYKSPIYKWVDLKKKAWEEISKRYGRHVKDVKNKVKSLRSAYVAEKKRVDESKKSGAGADELYQPNLFYFEAFSFLDDVIVLRKTKSNCVLDDTLERAAEAREDDEFVDSEDLLLPSTSSAKRKGRERNISSKYEDAINAIINSSSQVPEPDEQDKFTDFGRSIASQLKDLSPIEATAAMSDLQQTLSRHIIRSLRKKQQTSASSASTSVESNDILHCAIMNSEIFDCDDI